MSRRPVRGAARHRLALEALAARWAYRAASWLDVVCLVAKFRPSDLVVRYSGGPRPDVPRIADFYVAIFGGSREYLRCVDAELSRQWHTGRWVESQSC
jgi:hypothetical protein